MTTLASPTVYQFYADSGAADPIRSTKFRKDILRVGRWRIGDRVWNVTRETIAEIAANFDRSRKAGNRVPLVWGHSQSARDKAGEVVGLSITDDGRELTMEVAAQDPKARESLRNVDHAVSVEVREPYVDGRGNQYSALLTHVGIVQHPVIPGQGPFVQLSLESSGMGKSITRQLAEDEVTDMVAEEGVSDAVDTSAEPGSPSSNMIAVKDVVEMFAKATGQTLSADIDTVKELKIVVDMLFGAPASDVGADVADAPEIDLTGDESVATLSIPAMRKQLKETRRQLSIQVQSRVADSKAAFVRRLDSMVNAGQISPQFQTGLLNAGEVSRWQMSILDPFAGSDGTSGPKTTTKVRRLATAQVPSIDGATAGPTDAECAAMAAKMLRRPVAAN